ncbi:IS5-like element ISC1234 family transposase [Saccharolobus solfataricus]
MGVEGSTMARTLRHIPNLMYYPLPPIEDMPWREKWLTEIKPVLDAMDLERVLGEGALVYLKLLIVMVLYSCSYRDAVKMVNVNVVVAWFVGRKVGKSTLHDFVGRLYGVRKKLLEISFKLEEKCLPSYLPASAHLVDFMAWLVDSFLLDLPPGKRSVETFREKAELERRDGNLERARKLLSLGRTKRRFEGRWTKKRGVSHYGLKAVAVISVSLFVRSITVKPANFSDKRFKSPLKGIKIADRGFSPSPTQLIAREKPFTTLRAHVEFFGTYLNAFWRPYGTTTWRNDVFLHVLGVIYNIKMFLAIQRRTPPGRRAVQL